MSRDQTRVYIGDLGSGGSKQELEREFETFGPLKSVWVARNPPGFAFIEFEDPRDADDAVREMDGRHVCGVRIRVELAKNSSKPGGRGGGRGYYGGGGGGGGRYRRRYEIFTCGRHLCTNCLGCMLCSIVNYKS